jgi:glycosyltransferase involved in cell wall biosynthesis
VVTKGLPSHFSGGVAARMLNLPCVWHAQDLVSERHFGLYRRLFGRAAAVLATRIIADGAPIKRQLPASLQAKVEVIHNGVAPEQFCIPDARDQVRAEFGIPEDALMVGSVGRFTPWKGQRELLRSFARVAETIPDAYLLLVGTAVFDNPRYEGELRRLAEETGLAERVIFAGFRDDLGRIFSAMDVLAYTSLEKDTSPLAILSAMAAGLPIVAFEIEGISEILNHGRDALLVSVGNLDALTQALSTLLGDKFLRETLGRSARRKLDARFSLEQHHRNMQRAFLQTLGSSHETSPIVSASTVCS